MAAGLEIERDHLGDNVITHSTGAGHSEALADTVAGSSGRLWAEVSSGTAGDQHQPASSRAIAALAAYGSQQHTLDAAEMFRDYDITIEAGPDRHGITQGAFLYVFEPGGNGIELFGDPGFLRRF